MPNLRRVEEGLGRLGRVGIAPFPFPAHRTGRADFPHPALRLASSRGTRRWSNVHASQTQDAEFAEDLIVGEPLRAAPLHLAPFCTGSATSGSTRSGARPLPG